MRSSRFNIYIPQGDENEFLAYNTFSRSCIKVSRRVKRILESEPIHEHFLNDQENEYMQKLSNLGMVITDEVNEDRELDQWFESKIIDNRFLDITVLTTYDCNLRCADCSGQSSYRESSVSADTCRHIILWIIRRLDEVRPATLRLVFAGGESLLNPYPIQRISEELYYSCRKRDIDIDIKLITNGTLLTGDFTDSLNQFGFSGITVTLNGSRAIHNDRTIQQIRKVLGKTQVTLQVNLNEDSRHELSGLLDALKDAGFNKNNRVMIRFKPAHNGIGDSCRENMACTYSSISTKDLDWVKKECGQRGLIVADDTVLGPCEASREFNYVIDPAGKIFKCTGFAGREEFIVGNIFTEDGMIRMNIRSFTSDLWQKCRGCPYIPMCGGGCRLSSQTLWGNIPPSDCKSEYQSRLLSGYTPS